MGLTNKSTGSNVVSDELETLKFSDSDKIIALAGNPNVGKSTVFNELTGMNQHTGNWPGKTVANAKGEYIYNNQKFTLVDIPGTYSLTPHSKEECVYDRDVSPEMDASSSTTTEVARKATEEERMTTALRVQIRQWAQ